MGDTKIAKANNDLMNTIHQMVAKEIIEKLQSGDVTPQDLAQAIKFLKDNNVQADLDSSPVLTQITEKLIEADELPFAVEYEGDDDADE